MGSQNSFNDDWLESYNDSDSAIDIEGWKIIAQGSGPEINLKGRVPARSFCLLKRADDRTLPDIKAGLIYTGALENAGKYLFLCDNFGNLIDSANCGNSWLGGDNQAK